MHKSINSDLIALYVPTMNGGGAERSMLKLAGAIAQKGFRVDLVLATAKGPNLADVPDTVRVVDLGAARVLTSLPALVRYLRRERPCGLIAAMDHANLVAVWAKLLSRVQTTVIASIRSVPGIPASSLSVAVRAIVVNWFIRAFRPFADRTVAVSQGVADVHAQLNGIRRDRIDVIHNPIITDELMDLSRQPLLHPWMQPGQPPVVLSVGRLTDVKDHATLIHAFAKVVAKGIDARLIILGEGEARPELEAWIHVLGLERRRAILPGFVNNPYPYMRACSAFVLPSKSEGLPGVLIEALACGCPVISTDSLGGAREILQDGRLGRLVPVGNVDAMADALEAVLTGRNDPVPSKALDRFRPGPAADAYLSLVPGVSHA